MIGKVIGWTLLTVLSIVITVMYSIHKAEQFLDRKHVDDDKDDTCEHDCDHK